MRNGCDAFTLAGEVKPDEKPIEHPADVCQCGHRREQHSSDPEEEPYCTVPGIEVDGIYADDCDDFMLAKTALEIAVDVAEGDECCVQAINEACAEFDRQADLAEFGGTEDESDVRTYCGECGCWDGYHSREAGCTECECVIGMAVLPPEEPGYAGYSVVYAVQGGEQYKAYLPHGANVRVVDGFLEIWHADKPALGITSIRTGE